MRPGIRVLDPGAGTGEFLLDVLDRCPRAEVHGWENNPALVRICVQDHRLRAVECRDALATRPREEFDLVIGNPPYYEVRGRKDLSERFAAVISGRPNVFAMFFQRGLEALRPGGRLAFVVPPSMNNGAYFESLRRHIVSCAAVERLELVRDPHLFDGAQQSVMLLVLVKGEDSTRHVFQARLGGTRPVPLFMEDPDRLRNLLSGHETLASLGFEVRTGRCVWNQRRADLRRSPSPGVVPLLWAHNLVDGRLQLFPDHGKRPQFVKEAKPDRGPAIVVNRIVGTVGGGALRSALVPSDMEFVGENHVNVVRPTSPGLFSSPRVSLDRVAEGLRSPRATEAVRLLTGNTQISATELQHLVPVLPCRAARATTPKSAAPRSRASG